MKGRHSLPVKESLSTFSEEFGIILECNVVTLIKTTLTLPDFLNMI